MREIRNGTRWRLRLSSDLGVMPCAETQRPAEGPPKVTTIHASMRALLVEDDLMIGDVIQAALKDASYASDWVKTGPDALSALSSHDYDIVLLDLGLPGTDGSVVLRTLRSDGSKVAVIVITARDEVEDRVLGLDGGADDYVAKPFDMAELLARMRAVLRRKGGQGEPVLTNGVITLDPATHEASIIAAGTTLSLSHREFALLHALMIRPGAIRSRRDLEERIYGWGQEVESNAVEFLIHGLRRKLGPDTIKNVRGAGWMVQKRG